MFNPSQPLVIGLVVVAVVCLALGLDTDVGLFGWSATVLLGLYLAVVGVKRRSSR
jgi:hypothetical protein